MALLEEIKRLNPERPAIGVDSRNTDDCRTRLANMVCDQVEELENGVMITADNVDDWEGEIGERLTAADWLRTNAYDELYLIDSRGEILEVQILVAGGGPTLWVHFKENGFSVHGYWGADHIQRSSFHGPDAIGIFDYYLETRRRFTSD